jgi:hypothetical protein
MKSSSEIVWRFQSRFGVEKVRVVEKDRGKKFAAVECDDKLKRSSSESRS